MIDWIIARAKEPTTWRGILMLLGGLGVIDQTQEHNFIEALELMGAAAIGSGVIGMIAEEKR